MVCCKVNQSDVLELLPVYPDLIKMFLDPLTEAVNLRMLLRLTTADVIDNKNYYLLIRLLSVVIIYISIT